jgi:hypothetical protein
MDLHRIRYRGDKEDVELLFKDYNLEGIISTSEERQKMEESDRASLTSLRKQNKSSIWKVTTKSFV